MMTDNNALQAQRRTNLISTSLLVSISYLALNATLGASIASAQSAAQAPLPPVTVAAPEAKRRATTPSHSADRGGQRRRTRAARRAPEPVAAPAPASLAYAYTDAHITSATSATVVPGNRVQLVPNNQVAWWNRYQIDPTWGIGLGVIYFSDHSRRRTTPSTCRASSVSTPRFMSASTNTERRSSTSRTC